MPGKRGEVGLQGLLPELKSDQPAGGRSGAEKEGKGLGGGLSEVQQVTLTLGFVSLIFLSSRMFLSHVLSPFSMFFLPFLSVSAP